MDIKFVCKECNKEIDKDSERSNENWSVAPKKCPHCGGKIELKINKSE